MMPYPQGLMPALIWLMRRLGSLCTRGSWWPSHFFFALLKCTMQPDKCSGERHQINHYFGCLECAVHLYYHQLGQFLLRHYYCLHSFGVTSIDRHIGGFFLVLNECLFSSLSLQRSLSSEALFISLFGVVGLRVSCVLLHLSCYLFTVFFIKPVERCAHRSFIY